MEFRQASVCVGVNKAVRGDGRMVNKEQQTSAVE
jgi:hypothetical protein